MKYKIEQKNIVILSVVAVFLLGIIGYVVYSTTFQKENLPVHQAAPEFSMNDVNGKTISFEKGEKVKLVYFFFASCSDVCPISNQIMKGVQDKLKTKRVFGKEVELFSITIDPIRDTSEVLKEYAELFGADDSGWHFLRSDTPQEVRIVSEGFNTGVLNEDGKMMHADLIILVDKNNQIREYYIDKDIDTIVKDVLSLI